MKKQILLFILAILPLMTWADDSGTCGENVTYYYEESSKTLTISGSGEMANYNNYNKFAPWWNYKNAITSLVIDNGLTSIGSYAFGGCSGLTSIKIPDGVTSICDGAFLGCSGLTSVTIPEGMTSISSSVFLGCSGLISVNIPDGVTSIGDFAFQYCSGLTSIILPDGVTIIGSHAFSGCSSLTSIKIPDGVTSIDGDVFSGCSGLASIILPEGLTNIDGYAFSGCSSLTSINIPESVTRIGVRAFFGCRSLTSINIPEGVTRINSNVFSYCTGIMSIILPKSLQVIGEQAFYECRSLESITIPSSVEFIYQQAFSGCGLKEVKALAETPPFAYDNTFGNYDIPLLVPEASISSYQSTNPWSKFTSLKTLTGGDVEVKKCATPTISYNNGRISFGCETEDVEYSSSITDTDIKNYTTATIDLGVTYTITVYATKSGYQNSDVATATLCWIDVDPRTEGLTTDATQVMAKAVMIQSNDGVLTVSGADDGTDITVYSVSGKMVGHAKATGNKASLTTNLQKGDIAIVKIGDKSVKVVMQ